MYAYYVSNNEIKLYQIIEKNLLIVVCLSTTMITWMNSKMTLCQ